MQRAVRQDTPARYEGCSSSTPCYAATLGSRLWTLTWQDCACMRARREPGRQQGPPGGCWRACVTQQGSWLVWGMAASQVVTAGISPLHCYPGGRKGHPGPALSAFWATVATFRSPGDAATMMCPGSLREVPWGSSNAAADCTQPYCASSAPAEMNPAQPDPSEREAKDPGQRPSADKEGRFGAHLHRGRGPGARAPRHRPVAKPAVATMERLARKLARGSDKTTLARPGTCYPRRLLRWQQTSSMSRRARTRQQRTSVVPPRENGEWGSIL